MPPGVPTCGPSWDTSLASREPLVARKFYELYIFPLLNPGQTVGVIPGLYGNSTQSNCADGTNGSCRSPAQDEYNTAKLQGYWDWAATESRLELIMPWHWADGSNSTWKKTAAYSQYNLGAKDFPKVLKLLGKIGAAVKKNNAGGDSIGNRSTSVDI